MSKNWYQNWFNHLYPKIYPHRNLAEAELQVNSLLSFLKLKNKNTCLDIACGTGRHVKFLSKEFKQCTGIDLSKDLIKIGKEKGNFDKAEAFIRDMREPKLEKAPFDLVCNFFTGFGYFREDSEHQALINTWLSLVTENGTLFIDYLNKDHVIKNLVPKTVREIDNFHVTETRQIVANRVEKTIIIESNQHKPQEFKESVLMYNSKDMRNFLSKSAKIEIYGDYNFLEFNQDSPRMLLVVKK